MSRLFQRAAALAALSCLSQWAASATHDGTGFTLTYDPDGALYTHEVESFGSVSTEVLPQDQVSYSPSATGLSVNFLHGLGVWASSYTSFTPQMLAGTFALPLSLEAAPGYHLTGYSVTIEGSYSIESPGFVNVDGIFSASDSGLGPFMASSGVIPFGGGSLPLSGSFVAYADISYVEVLVGYEDKIVGYEEVLDYCDEIQCYYRQEPIIEQVPVYDLQTDLGEASLVIDRITITAHVEAVPEPGSMALAFGGMMLMGVFARRRREGAAQA